MTTDRAPGIGSATKRAADRFRAIPARPVKEAWGAEIRAPAETNPQVCNEGSYVAAQFSRRTDPATRPRAGETL
jgi:hypothetical protein